jgi:uncharacterized membrane protein YcgQ (UPF0703/DUF1980 family)
MIDKFINDEFGNYTFIILSILIGLLVILIIYPNIMNQNQNEGFKIDEQINQILNKFRLLDFQIARRFHH